MIGKTINFFKKRPGFAILVAILSLITLANVKPDFYLLGWDNYSSYFNLNTNIFRTFFATWREYRGLGVPSDAEVTDVFRQIFYWFLHFFISEQLLSQIYYFLALWVGVIGMYFFSDLLWMDLGNKNDNQDFFASVASFFYLFNLNTLSVFYALIIPFINRFYSLPLTLFLFIRFVRSKRKIKDFFILAIVIILTSGTYITPTLIITSLIAFIIYAWSFVNLKKVTFYCIVFLALNAFWVLPFLNYTINKSPIIPLARTFVEINEATLNQSPLAFSIDKQIILRPSFFDMSYNSLNGNSFTVHPLLNDYQKPINKYILFIFPILFIGGGLLILLEKDKKRKLLWVPVWILLFLFLSMKEYSPLGFIYVLFKRYIPYFDVIFRIGDTKFHSYVALSGSIAASYCFVKLINALNKEIIKKILIFISFILCISYFWLFRSYLTGDLMGFFVYVKIPEAYFRISKVINSDPTDSRVLHLPMDNWQNYWRSYSWGYFGSAFFNYLLDKPYIDKTFEPGSMENSYLDSKINKILDSFYQATNNQNKLDQANNFLQLLKDTGIKYLIVDKSLSTDIYTRNMNYNAKQTVVRILAMMDYLKNDSTIENLGNYPIYLSQIYPDYQKLYPVRETSFSNNLPDKTSVDLYEISSVRPKISFVTNSINVDPGLDNLLETNLNFLPNVAIQDENKAGIIYPFQDQKNSFSHNNQEVALSYKELNKSLTSYKLSSNNSRGPYFIDVYGRVNNNVLHVDFYYRYYPDINGNKFQRYIGSAQFPITDSIVSSDENAEIASNWSFDNTKQISFNYRLNLNGIFIPLPANVSSTETYITSYLLDDTNIRASLFKQSLISTLSKESFTTTDPPSCYGLNSYCLNAPVIFPKGSSDNQYLEVEIKAKGMVKQNNNSRSKESLPRQVLNAEGLLPIPVYICVKQGTIPGCLNLHSLLNISTKSKSYLIPLQSDISSLQPAEVLVGSVPINNNQESINMDSVTQIFYSKISDEKDIIFDPILPKVNIDLTGLLTISFPKALSNYSFFFNPAVDFYNTSQTPCKGGSKRVTSYLDGIFFNDEINCDSYFYEGFQYAYQRPYLFSADYFLGSGQYPYIVLGKNGVNNFLERISLYQGYPWLFDKRIQDVGFFDSYSSVEQYLGNVKLITASRLIDPSTVSDSYSTNMNIHIFQTTENEGLLALRSLNMIDYPMSWYSMSLKPENATNSYLTLSNGKVFYKQILPSLWQLTVDFPQVGNYMLFFNEGYDAQWRLMPNNQKSLKCNGYANCFLINYTGKPNSQTIFYIFYTPETLYLLGWLVTLSSLAVFLISRKRF